MQKCVITDTYENTLTTDTVTINIRASQLAIIKQPENVTVDNEGDIATVSVKATGDGLSYLWYYKNPNGTAFVSTGIKTSSISVPATQARNGREMYCVVTDKYGEEIISNTIISIID